MVHRGQWAGLTQARFEMRSQVLVPARWGTQESEASQETPSTLTRAGGGLLQKVPLCSPHPSSDSRLTPEGTIANSLLSFIPC